MTNGLPFSSRGVNAKSFGPVDDPRGVDLSVYADRSPRSRWQRRGKSTLVKGLVGIYPYDSGE